MPQSKLDTLLEQALRKVILEKGLEISEDEKIRFEKYELKKGSHVRTNTYVLTVDYPEGIPKDKSIKVFCKEYIREGESQDLAGKVKPDVNEEELAKLFGQVGGFVPKHYGKNSFTSKPDRRTFVHSLKFTADYRYNLEEKLTDLNSEKERLVRERQDLMARRPNIESNGTPIDFEDFDKIIRGKEIEVEKIEDTAGEWVKRFVDITLINNHLINQYPNEEVIEKSRARKYNHVSIAADMKRYFDILLKKIIPDKDKRETWEIANRYDKIMGTFIESAEYLARYSGEKISMFGPYPAHCLIKKRFDLSETAYEEKSIVRILDGQKEDEKTPYTGLAVCDLTKVGTYSPLMGLASLFTNPAVTRLLPRKKLQPQFETKYEKGGLLDHVLVAQKRIDTKGDKEELKYARLENISDDEQAKFLEHYKRAAVWATLRNLYFIAALEPERQEELMQARPLYQPETFARHCMDQIINMHDPSNKFEYLKAGFKDLYKVLNTNPLSREKDALLHN